MQATAAFTAQVLQDWPSLREPESEADSNPWGSGAGSSQDSARACCHLEGGQQRWILCVLFLNSLHLPIINCRRGEK